MLPKTCPFCGKLPVVLPTKEDVKEGKEGSAFGIVECINNDCPAQPRVNDGIFISDDRGSELYKEAAIKVWNTRY